MQRSPGHQKHQIESRLDTQTHRHTDKEEVAKVSTSRSPEAPDRVKVGLRVKMVVSCQSNLCPVDCGGVLKRVIASWFVQKCAKPNLCLQQLKLPFLQQVVVVQTFLIKPGVVATC